MKALQKTLMSNEIFQQLKDELHGWDIKSVANTAEVATSTIYFWLDGKTRFPRLDTIVKVAEAINMELILRKRGGTQLRLVK